MQNFEWFLRRIGEKVTISSPFLEKKDVYLKTYKDAETHYIIRVNSNIKYE